MKAFLRRTVGACALCLWLLALFHAETSGTEMPAAAIARGPSDFLVRPLMVSPDQASVKLRALVKRVASRNGLDARLVMAVIAAESAFDDHAVSQRNAMGLMQLTPETAARFGVRDPFDPEQNIRGGTTYLRWLLERFSGNLTLALAAYNAGEKTVEYYGGVPPFAETVEYINRVRYFVRAMARSRRDCPCISPCAVANRSKPWLPHVSARARAAPSWTRAAIASNRQSISSTPSSRARRKRNPPTDRPGRRGEPTGQRYVGHWRGVNLSPSCRSSDRD